MERAEQSTLWITASEDGASATCVGVAPACKELRSGPNKSEREPTSARSTNYGSGHLIPAFHGTGRTFSLLPSHPLDAASRSIDAPLVSCLRGKVPRPKMVSSNQKRFQLCFVRNSPRGTSEPRVFHPKREPRPSPPRWGAGSRESSFGGVRRAFCYEGSVSQIHGRGQNFLHGTSCCGIFATPGEYFSPITLLGDFPVRMSQIEHVGGRAHGRRDDSIDCDSGVRCRFCAGPLGHQARPPRRCEIEEGTVSDFTSSPNQACYLAITRTANLRYGKPRPAGSSPRAGRALTRSAPCLICALG